MSERTFKAKLRTKFKPHCYIQSMSSYATNGTPDLWLSGKRDVWIEVKYDPTTKGAITPKLSALQAKWLNDRQWEGREVYVIVGTSLNEGILYKKGMWNNASSNRRPLDFIIKDILDRVTA